VSGETSNSVAPSAESPAAATPAGAEPRLFADAMLGGLARWLRTLGLDVAYDPALDDAALVELSAREGRVILTQAYATPLSAANLASLAVLGTAAKVSDIAGYVVAAPASDEVTHSVYDRDGKLRYSFDARNYVTEYRYDATGNAIRSIAYTAAHPERVTRLVLFGAYHSGELVAREDHAWASRQHLDDPLSEPPRP